MTTPNDPPPEPDLPPDDGGDSVQALHRPHMDIMNDPVPLSLDGTAATTPETEEPDLTAGGQDSVQAIHGIVMREQSEPRDGFEPVPLWVHTVFAVLMMWGGYYLGTNVHDFRRDVYDTIPVSTAGAPEPAPAGPDPDPQTVTELMQIGADKYRSVCGACHKPDGTGDPSQQYPPLAGSEWVAGEQASAARQARIVLYGLNQPITVKGKSFNGQMPAQGQALRDYEIAAALTFARNSFGNKADPDDAKPAVTAAVVRAAREKVGKRDVFTPGELMAIPLDYADPPALRR